MNPTCNLGHLYIHIFYFNGCKIIVLCGRLIGKLLVDYYLFGCLRCWITGLEFCLYLNAEIVDLFVIAQ